MPQAIKTYEAISTLRDERDDLLNLAWTLDERELLSINLTDLITEQLQDEISNALQYVHSYFVKDPYGEELLGPAIAQYFAFDKPCAVTCGAGVISLLSSIARLSTGKTALVIGDVYTDFPYWLEQSNANCVTGEIDVHKPAIVFFERPSLIGDATEVQRICEAAAQHNAIVIIDESNANYYPPSFSAINLINNAPNLAVIRGFSKAYSLGGLRLAYCVSSPALKDAIRNVIPPLLPSSLSLKLGRKVLEQGDIAVTLRQTIKENKSKMKLLLEQAGLGSLILSSEYLPYIFITENIPEAARQLEAKGIPGKPHPVWRSPEKIDTIYRLSVPLKPSRMELFQKKIGG
jgi:histidinol-phosphate/aromatic aminotransferase/cobyric acid decarboxylase-like protein